MAADELNKPLGLTTRRDARKRTPPLKLAGGAAIVIVALAAIAWWVFPAGHGPTATALITTPAPGASQIAPDRTGSIATAAASAPTGSLSDVVPDGGLTDVGKVVIHDPSGPEPVVLASVPRDDLVENTADGPLPQISKDGARPLDVYARPSDVDPQAIRVAIVIGGIGIDPDGTAQAITTLPGTVTLAFAPYGDGLAKEVAAARGAGHEILLQIPLEPYNYPTVNPGPNTLTTSATAAENIDRLHWLLGRITDYVGVVNYMGARFTTDADALKPVVGEVGARGLLYLDDGSSGASVAATVATGGTPFLRADVVLDADLSADAIDARLSQLQAIARQRGYAIATGTAFPATIDRVSAFAKGAATKGIMIVPVSALARNEQ